MPRFSGKRNIIYGYSCMGRTCCFALLARDRRTSRRQLTLFSQTQPDTVKKRFAVWDWDATLCGGQSTACPADPPKQQKMLASHGIRERSTEHPLRSVAGAWSYELDHVTSFSPNDIQNKRIMLLQGRIQAQEQYIAALKESATRSIVSCYDP